MGANIDDFIIKKSLALSFNYFFFVLDVKTLLFNMKSISPSEISTAEVHAYLLSAVAPRPIALASTINAKGEVNLSPFSFFNVFSANPPIMIFSPARRGRDNTTKHTFENVLEVKEVVINIVDFDIVEQTSLSSTEYAEGINEFEKAGFTALPSEKIKPPRVAESPVQYECIVKDVIQLGQEGGAGNLVICEVVKIHVQERVLDDNGNIDPLKINLVGRMGGNFYTKAFGDALFEIEKPIRNLGIGVDKIPSDIKNSSVLTGNNLGQLGNVESLPNETDVNDYRLIELSEIFMELEDEPKALELKLHEMAKDLLAKGAVLDAWKTLLAFNN